MTETEKHNAGVVEGGLMLLHEAIQNNHPSKELEVRVKDLLHDIRRLTRKSRLRGKAQCGPVQNASSGTQ
jgi:hypothetical protein